MTDQLKPAEVFPPGGFIREELEVRGWRQSDLAEIIGRSETEVSRILTGKTSITEETARQLGEAFGTGPEYWLNLQTAYSLANLPPNAKISEKSRVFGFAPVSEMRRRGWIKKTNDVAELRSELCRFFDVDSLEDRPPFAAAARKYEPTADPTCTQAAWLYRARHVASGLKVSAFDHDRLPELEAALRELIASPQQTKRIAEVFAEYGIRFVIVEPLPGGKIDGAAFWLDDAGVSSPVIAISFRFDRIDAFWFTVVHEYAHILFGDGNSFDNDLAGHDQRHFSEKEAQEQRADKKAVELLLSQSDLDSFVMRTAPYYSKIKIIRFANRLKVHPGIVVGQLQFRGEIPWTHHKAQLLQGTFREIVVTGVSATDGWGQAFDPSME